MKFMLKALSTAAFCWALIVILDLGPLVERISLLSLILRWIGFWFAFYLYIGVHPSFGFKK